MDKTTMFLLQAARVLAIFAGLFLVVCALGTDVKWKMRMFFVFALLFYTVGMAGFLIR